MVITRHKHDISARLKSFLILFTPFSIQVVRSICSDCVETILFNDILPTVPASPLSSLAAMNPSYYNWNCNTDCQSSKPCSLRWATDGGTTSWAVLQTTGVNRMEVDADGCDKQVRAFNCKSSPKDHQSPYRTSYFRYQRRTGIRNNA